MPQRPQRTKVAKWPDSGPHRKLLELLDEVREREGRRSFEEIAKRAGLTKSRVSDVFTGPDGPTRMYGLAAIYAGH